MSLNILVACAGLFAICKSITYNGCDLFSNRFTVESGVLHDVCGSIALTPSSGNLNSANQVYKFSGKRATFSNSVAFTGNKFAIVIEGRRSGSASGFDIILGPGGCNCQIRYEAPNKLGIYSYYTSPTYWQSFNLPYDIDVLHTLILYYSFGTLYVYQNDALVTSITKSFDISLGRIAGWYSNPPYFGDIEIKNIMFAFNKDINDIRNYVYTCVALNGVSTYNALISNQVSDTDDLNTQSVESASIISTHVILAFVAGIGTMLILNAFCLCVYQCHKKKNVNNNDRLNGAQVLQQIEMDDQEMDDQEMDKEEMEQITNTNEI